MVVKNYIIISLYFSKKIKVFPYINIKISTVFFSINLNFYCKRFDSKKQNLKRIIDEGFEKTPIGAQGKKPLTRRVF